MGADWQDCPQCQQKILKAITKAKVVKKKEAENGEAAAGHDQQAVGKSPAVPEGPSGTAPAQSDAAPAQSDAAPAQSDAAPAQYDAAPAQSDADPAAPAGLSGDSIVVRWLKKLGGFLGRPIPESIKAKYWGKFQGLGTGI